MSSLNFINICEKVKTILENPSNRVFLIIPNGENELENYSFDEQIEILLYEDNLFFSDPYSLIDIDAIELEDDETPICTDDLNEAYFLNENFEEIFLPENILVFNQSVFK